MRRLGSPAFPRRAFEAIRDYFGKEADLLTVWHEKRLVGGVQCFYFRDQVLPYYAAASQEAFHLGVNDFMYWELMCQAGRDGYRTFDFSRSRIGSGSYEFKCHWGFTPEPLAYQYLLISDHDIPNFSPSNPRLRLFIETWKRLPVPITRWLGPFLTRRLPVD
jgi:FemAB-related protein (PEP-CTERM system-associated)